MWAQFCLLPTLTFTRCEIIAVVQSSSVEGWGWRSLGSWSSSVLSTATNFTSHVGQSQSVLSIDFFTIAQVHLKICSMALFYSFLK